MNREIKIDVPALMGKTELLSDESEYLKQKLGELSDSIAELNVCWSGNAADAFGKSIRKDISDLEMIISAIAGAAGDYRFALKAYSDCEQRLSEITESVPA